jgi:hypothetical protein
MSSRQFWQQEAALMRDASAVLENVVGKELGNQPISNNENFGFQENLSDLKGKKINVYYVNTTLEDGNMSKLGKIGDSTIKEIISVATDILERNNIAKYLKFIPTSISNAKKYTEGSKNTAFLAIVNSDYEVYSYPGLSRRRDGAIAVFDIDAVNGGTKWYSYVNYGYFGNSPSNALDRNVIYAVGYTFAHEILHQLLSFASKKIDSDATKFEHTDTPSLNLEGPSVITHWIGINEGKISKDMIKKLELIIPSQKNYLNEFLINYK